MDLLPIGTIITSYLNWSEFEKVAGDPLNWDAKTSLWSPADGRVVSTSRFSTALNKINVPDYRGAFLRCNNVIDASNVTAIPAMQADPDGARDRNSFQKDDVQTHAHSYTAYIQWAQGGNGFVGSGFESNSGQGSHVATSSVFGDATETRPKNYAVYFYIKIN